MRELRWTHRSSGVDPGSATRSGPKVRTLNRTHKIVAVIVCCTIVVLLAMALAVSNKPLAVASLQMPAGDSFLAAQSAPADAIQVDGCAPGPGEYGTLAGAVAAASPGDTIVMQGGSYPETDSVSFLEKLVIDKALTLTASDGPALVGEYYVGSGEEPVPVTYCPGCKVSVPFDANAMVYHPSDSPGGTQIACGGPFPAVVYAHGLRSESSHECPSWSDPGHPNQDYHQAGGILKRLAGSGIIAISVDHDGEGLKQKRDIITSTVAYLRDEHNAPGSWLEDAVDLENVGLAGHSTGATAVNPAISWSPVPIRALGLIAPAIDRHAGVPVLIIHGTNEHPCQAGIFPVEAYRDPPNPKHLVVVDGANHFGYTDGICLDPDYDRGHECFSPQDPEDDLMESPGMDNPSRVGGVEAPEAHTRQQLAAGYYLQAFFSEYLNLPGKTGALEYLTGGECDLPEDYPVWETVDSQPERHFDDLENLNVQVWVFSCE